MMISCIEEIAYRMGYIDEAGLLKCAEPLASNEYGQYLLRLVKQGCKDEKILLFAKNGQLGYELQRTPLGEVIALDFPEVDFSKPQELAKLVQEVQPDILVNPAAYTAVDKAESEQEIAYLVNRDSPAVLAEAAAKLRIPFLHYSTDYVYDGTKGSAYVETDATNPLNVYGKSKLEGDNAALAAGGADWCCGPVGSTRCARAAL